MIDILLDTFIDAIKLLPFLFLTYLAMEYLEEHHGEKAEEAIKKAGRLGPLFGGILGVVPQCGFSAAAANLYAGRVISIGTLYAVFLSTSDEMLPILISSAAPVPFMGKILLAKAVIGVGAGFFIDFAAHALRRRKNRKEEDDLQIEMLCEAEHCHCEEGSILKSAVTHTAHILLFVAGISFLLNLAYSVIGEETLRAVLANKPVIGELAAGLMGLIPNCAASILLTKLYLDGILSVSQLVAGLLVGAGVGILVLFRVNPDKKESLKIVGLLYCMGVAAGLLLRLFLYFVH